MPTRSERSSFRASLYLICVVLCFCLAALPMLAPPVTQLHNCALTHLFIIIRRIRNSDEFFIPQPRELRPFDILRAHAEDLAVL